MNGLEVYVANLSKYTEGSLVGDWIKLPVSEKELDAFLKEKVEINQEYSEYAIHDYNETFMKISEYAPLADLNLLASQLATMTSEEINKCQLYIENEGISSPLEALNVCVQVDYIPFYSYVDDVQNCVNMSNEEKYGYTVAEANGLYEKLSDLGIENYFDYEALGRDESINGSIDLTDEGYFISNEKLNLHEYSREELGDMIQLPNLEQGDKLRFTVQAYEERFSNYSPVYVDKDIVNIVMKEYDGIKTDEAFKEWLSSSYGGQRVMTDMVDIANDLKEAGFVPTESVLHNMYILNKDKSCDQKLSLKDICDQYKSEQCCTLADKHLIDNIGNELKSQEMIMLNKNIPEPVM